MRSPARAKNTAAVTAGCRFRPHSLKAPRPPRRGPRAAGQRRSAGDWRPGGCLAGACPSNGMIRSSTIATRNSSGIGAESPRKRWTSMAGPRSAADRARQQSLRARHRSICRLPGRCGLRRRLIHRRRRSDQAPAGFRRAGHAWSRRRFRARSRYRQPVGDSTGAQRP